MQIICKAVAVNQRLASPALANRLLAAVSSDALMLLKPDLKQVTLPQGALCFRPGDPIDQIYFPQSGMISCLIGLRDGEVVETASVGREGAVGLQSGLGHRYAHTKAVVQIPGRFSTIAATRFEEAVTRSPLLGDVIIRYIESLWAEAQQNAACNAVHDSSSRLCRRLLQCADKIGSEQVPLTQDFLAQMLGIRRTTVTLLAQELQKNELIRYRRGRITILDRPTLESRACECREAFKLEGLANKSGSMFARP